MIEEGRHKRPRLPREHRYCPHCTTVVEDETHFLTQCSVYSNDRNILYEATNTDTPNFTNLDDNAKYIFLMSQENLQLTQKIVPTIHKWMTERLNYKKK